jgi:hypothetical protein
MRAFYFNQGSLLITISDRLLDFGIVDIGHSLDLSPTIRNTGTASQHLQNIFDQHSILTHNRNPLDRLIFQGDSLTITVTFNPANTNLIIDSLPI